MYLLIIISFIYIVTRYFIVKSRCERVGQKVSISTYLFIPQLYELVTTRDRGTESERRIINRLMKGGLKPTAVYHDFQINLKDYLCILW